MGFVDALPGIGSIVSGLSGLFGSAIGSKRALKAQRETNALNKELAYKQNEWNLEQWQRENEYNSPENQIELLKKAGLNPNLYGGQGATAGQLVSADLANQEAPPPSAFNPLPADSISNVLQGLLGIAEVKKLESETNRNNAAAGLDHTRQVNEMTAGKYIDALKKGEIALQNSTLQVQGSVKTLNEEQANTLKKQQLALDEQIKVYQSQVAKNMSDVALNYANVRALDKRVQLEIERLAFDKEQGRIMRRVWRAQCAQLYAAAEESRARKGYIASQTEGQNLANALLDCTFTYEVGKARVGLEMLGEQQTHIRIMNQAEEDFRYINQVLGSMKDILIGIGAACAGYNSFKSGRAKSYQSSAGPVLDLSQ